MSKILVAAVALMVTRDAMTILPVTVPAHEVDVVKTVFGEDNVQLREGAKPELIEIEVVDDEGRSVESERLEAKYGQGALEKAFGTNYKSQIGKAVAAVAEKAGQAATPAAVAGDLATMTKAQLIAEAEKRGVGVVETMTKAEIIAALQAA